MDEHSGSTGTTLYRCGHPSHRRGPDAGVVDVTAQVRLERAMLPRPQVYLAITEDVVDLVMRLDDGPDRRGRIEGLVSGDAAPHDLPVVLMSRRSVDREPGRYELDDLRAEETEVERVVSRVGPSHVPTVDVEDDVIVLDDAGTVFGSAPAPAPGGTAVLTRRQQDAPTIVPQGIYRLSELAAGLAVADRDEHAILDAIGHTPRFEVAPVGAEPWRVIVTCPQAEGSPPMAHDVLFTGTGHAEPSMVLGTPVDTWDEEVEASAVADMTPGAETSRVERRVWLLLGAEVAVASALLLAGWVSGGLALAARETPGWLGLALILLGSAVAFAAAPLFAVRDRTANMNDTFWLEHLYASRVDLFRLAAAISGALFGFALLVGVIPPLFADARPLPAATVTFDTSTRPSTATVKVEAVGVGADDVLSVTIREFGMDLEGVLVGHVTRHGDPSGELSFSETVAVDAGASYLSVLVSEDPSRGTACGPTATGSPGCVVLAVPQSTPIALRILVTPVPPVGPSPGTGSPSDVVPTDPPTATPPSTTPTTGDDRSGG